MIVNLLSYLHVAALAFACLPSRRTAPVPRLGPVENKLDALKAKGQIHSLPVDPLHAPFLVLGVGVV